MTASPSEQTTSLTPISAQLLIMGRQMPTGRLFRVNIHGCASPPAVLRAAARIMASVELQDRTPNRLKSLVHSTQAIAHSLGYQKLARSEFDKPLPNPNWLLKINNDGTVSATNYTGWGDRKPEGVDPSCDLYGYLLSLPRTLRDQAKDSLDESVALLESCGSKLLGPQLTASSDIEDLALQQRMLFNLLTGLAAGTGAHLDPLEQRRKAFVEVVDRQLSAKFGYTGRAFSKLVKSASVERLLTWIDRIPIAISAFEVINGPSSEADPSHPSNRVSEQKEMVTIEQRDNVAYIRKKRPSAPVSEPDPTPGS